MFFSFKNFTKENLLVFLKQYLLYFLLSTFLIKILENLLLVIRFHFYNLELITVTKNLFLLLLFLKKSFFFLFEVLLDIIVCDFILKKKYFRYSITYIILSLKYNVKFYITSFLNEFDSLMSITKLYINANWYEREVWDMFGIFFLSHPDLRRILTDYGFYYFPLRKDFPLTGFFELAYNDKKKKIIQNPVSLTQEYRFFNLKNNWII
jgi:NADH dehydrogenase (ubiquinone) Fe-S protein 3